MSSSPLGSPVLGIPFSINNDLFPSDFPSHLDLKAPEDFSSQPYEESFKLAQEARAPYYSVAVVYCSDDSGIGEYKVYDTIRFNTLCRENTFNEDGSLIDPFTNKTIRNIYFFALTCFEIDKEDTCRPVDLTDGKLRFVPIEIPKEEEAKHLDLILFDSVNFYTLLKKSKKEHQSAEQLREIESSKREVRRKEYIIAGLIRDKTIFPDLTEEERRDEVIKWLWCASYESLVYRPLLDLVRLYNPENPTHAEIIKQLFSTIKPAPKEKIPHAESRAYLDLQELRSRLSKRQK